MRIRGLYVDESGLVRCLPCRGRAWQTTRRGVDLAVLHAQSRHPELLAAPDTPEDLLR